MNAEFRYNQDRIKNQLNEMQSNLEVLMMRVNEGEKQVTDIEHTLMTRKKTEEKNRKTIKR